MKRSITADPSRGGSGIRLKAASTTLVTPRSMITHRDGAVGLERAQRPRGQEGDQDVVVGPASDTMTAWLRGALSFPMFTGTGLA